MRKYIHLYLLFIKYSWTRAMMYRENFIIWSFVTFGWTILNFIFYQFIYLNVNEIAGWTKPQVLLLLGMYFIFDFIVWGLYWQNMRQIPIKINKGTMDLELVKPINHQFLLSFKHIGNDNFNSAVFGLVTIIYALHIGNIHPSFFDIFLSLLSIIIAAVYVYSSWFTTMCFAFWFDRITNLDYFFPGLRHFWRVPQPFYKGILRGILTFVIPVTLVTTVPAEFLLKRPPLLFFLVLLFFAFITLLFSNWFFKIAIRHYSSASS